MQINLEAMRLEWMRNKKRGSSTKPWEGQTWIVREKQCSEELFVWENQ